MGGFLAVTDQDTLTPRGISVVSKHFQPRASATVSIVGDSHAEFWGASAAASAWGSDVIVDGIAGQQSIDLTARLGGLPARVTVTGNMLPASGSVTVTSIKDASGTNIRPLRTGDSGTVTRPGVLAGVPVTLRTTDLGVSYTIVRNSPGFAVPIPAGTPLVMGGGYRETVPVILPPRNDVGKDEASTLWRTPLATILTRYRALVDWLAPDGRFIILSMLPWADESAAGKAAREELDAAFRDESPQQWLDWAGFLRADAAFTAAGVTKTSQDTIDITNGVTPTSFRRPSDTGHLNVSGYAAANAFLAPALATIA